MTWALGKRSWMKMPSTTTWTVCKWPSILFCHGSVLSCVGFLHKIAMFWICSACKNWLGRRGAYISWWPRRQLRRGISSTNFFAVSPKLLLLFTLFCAKFLWRLSYKPPHRHRLSLGGVPIYYKSRNLHKNGISQVLLIGLKCWRAVGRVDAHGYSMNRVNWLTHL